MATLSEAPVFDVEAAITDFLSDGGRSSLELPHLNAAQRKTAKKVAERHSELTCESFGFGNERQLHIFKKAGSASTAFSVKNTFIDDFVSVGQAEGLPEPVVFRSMPPQLQKGLVQATISEHGCAPDLTPIRERERPCVLTRTASPDRSTTASVSSPAVASPASSTRTLPTDVAAVLPPPGLSLPPGLQVRNTFISIENKNVDGREVQSMPHGMFGQCLLAELEQRGALSALEEAAPLPPPREVPPPGRAAPVAAVERDEVLVPGTEVIIQGLLKLPAFNGLKGSVQSFDAETGRYSILLAQAAGAHKWAKVKRDNLQVQLPPLPPTFAPTLATVPMQLEDPVMQGYSNPCEIPATPMWDGCAVGKQRLSLTALV